MDKLITTDNGGLPFNLDDIRFFLGQDTYDAGIYQAIEAILLTFGTDFIVQGCASPGDEGWIMLDSELLRVDTHVSTDTYYEKVTTYNSTGSKTAQDGISVEMYQQNRATATASSGTLTVTGDDFQDTLFTKMGILRQKVVDIGDWNMNVTAGGGTSAVTVAHGLDYTKIRRVTALVRPDAAGSSVLYEIGKISGGGFSVESNIYVGSTNIALSINTGGYFDSNNDFDDTSYNRGWIIIDYTD